MHGKRYFDSGIECGIVATYWNIVMGVFQAASIIELFFVLGQIAEAARQNQSEPKPPPLIGVALTYITATLISLGSLGAMIFFLIKGAGTTGDEKFSLREQFLYSFYAFMGLGTLFIIVVVMIGTRLCLLRK